MFPSSVPPLGGPAAFPSQPLPAMFGIDLAVAILVVIVAVAAGVLLRLARLQQQGRGGRRPPRGRTGVVRRPEFRRLEPRPGQRTA
jgi:hypothetical protein